MPVIYLFFPSLKADIARRDRAHLLNRPIVLLDGVGEAARVTGRSWEAGHAGVVSGMAAGTARRFAPRAAFVPDNRGDCEAFLGDLAARIGAEGCGVARTERDGVTVHVGEHATVAGVVRAAGLPDRGPIVWRAAWGRDEWEARQAARARRSEQHGGRAQSWRRRPQGSSDRPDGMPAEVTAQAG